MPRFVILRHNDPRGSHFDFMLESGGVLKTWALPEPPCDGAEIPCEALADHRLAYLDYEGPISGGRGDVVQWDHGVYFLDHQNDAHWTVELTGEKLSGTVILNRSVDDPRQWTLRFLAETP